MELWTQILTVTTLVILGIAVATILVTISSNLIIKAIERIMDK